MPSQKICETLFKLVIKSRRKPRCLRRECKPLLCIRYERDSRTYCARVLYKEFYFFYKKTSIFRKILHIKCKREIDHAPAY